MIQLVSALKSLIPISENELQAFLLPCEHKHFKRKSYLSEPDSVANEVFFLCSGMLRVVVVDVLGVEHTVHFALENQFIADYSAFLTRQPIRYYLQAIENLDVVSIPRSVIEWGYNSLENGQALGRLIAENYFVYLDSRIKDLYSKTPKQRYDSIAEVFPNIHNRVPQHMIASYLGITPVHLSRLKKQSKR